MRKLFGTDGIRGIANEKLTREFSYLIGKCGACVLSDNSTYNKKIVIGMDTRISSPLIEESLCSGISSYGVDVIRVSYVPTPAISYLIRKYNLIGGIMVSASHNPYEYNGIKFFDSYGVKLSDDLEKEIEKLYFDSVDKLEIVNMNLRLGKIKTSNDAIVHYEKFLLSFLDSNLDGLKIAIDCANGASYDVAQRVFKKTGAEVVVINNKPNGININCDCGSMHMDKLREVVINNNCDFGFAYDGDADRCLAVDKNGNIINGDFIIAIISMYFKNKGILHKDTVVSTVMSNIGLEKSLNKYGINISKVCVGDKYVFQNMNENGYVVGGEQSGHVILFDNKTGDGILTSLIVSDIIKQSGKTLEDLASCIDEFPQVLINVEVPEEYKSIYREDREIINLIEKYEHELFNNGRILVRESGTENFIRIMVEGKNKKNIEYIGNAIAMFIKDKVLN